MMFLSSTSEPWVVSASSLSLNGSFMKLGVWGFTTLPHLCPSPILNHSCTSLVCRQGVEDRPPSRISLPGEKKKWLNYRILRAERKQQQQVNVCLPHRYGFPRDQPLEPPEAPELPCQPSRGSSSAKASEQCSLYRSDLVKNWVCDQLTQCRIPRCHRCLKDFLWRIIASCLE